MKNKKGKKVEIYPGLIKSLLIRVIIVLILVAVFFVAGIFAWKKLNKVQIEKSYVTVEKQLSTCAELVTMKLKYTDIVTLKKKTVISKSYSIVKYTGIIRAGIPNLDESDFKISDDRKTLEIILPDAVILGNDIMAQEVFDEQRSAFVPLSTQEIFDEIDTSRQLMIEQAISDGILDEARAHAENIIRGIMLGAGFENVTVY